MRIILQEIAGHPSRGQITLRYAVAYELEKGGSHLRQDRFAFSAPPLIIHTYLPNLNMRMMFSTVV